MTYMALFVRQCIKLELGEFSAHAKKQLQDNWQFTALSVKNINIELNFWTFFSKKIAEKHLFTNFLSQFLLRC